ncbi:MAG: RNA-guided pseudouridylation complex pseudouridine synthase subunit Cbf5 [Methanomicrobiales archaeon]|nr:RNA-guided pseudouridylation complex pseudouridine synthase subunit Cbf5 [Methanomicrobiales archaeon]
MTPDPPAPEPAARPLTGILIVDKPRGPTSHEVTAWAGRLLRVPVGHSGTLDPGVSGVLVVMTGRAVKLAPVLQKSDKEYVCLVCLHGDRTREQVKGMLGEFTGRIYQRPPRKSAVKRSLRIRTIHGIDLLDLQGRHLLIRVRCDAGTYIRSLAHHLGLALGTGAHMEELRRTRSGSFGEGDAHTLHEIADAVSAAGDGEPEHLARMVLPVERAVAGIPAVTIRDSAVDALCHGAALAVPGIAEHCHFRKGETVAIFTGKGELVCTAEALVSSEEIRPGKGGLVAAPGAVVMDPATYPKGWRKRSERMKKD